MPKIIRSHKLFHNDDFTLTLEHPKEFAQYTKLSEAEIVRRFEIFSRIMFNHLLTEDQRCFEIIKDPNTGEYAYFFNKP